MEQQVFETLKNRRSIRKFKKEQLTEAQLEKLVQAAQFAPSGMNKQSRQITVLQDQTRIEKLRAAIGRALNRPDYELFGADTLILLSDNADNHLGLADCACSLENIFLMATAMGLGSCWVNQLRDICDVPPVRALLDDFGVPATHRVWGIAALGVPDEAPELHAKACSVHYAR